MGCKNRFAPQVKFTSCCNSQLYRSCTHLPQLTAQEPLLGTNSWERKINRPAPAKAGRTTGSPWGAVVEAKVSQFMTMEIKSH